VKKQGHKLNFVSDVFHLLFLLIDIDLNISKQKYTQNSFRLNEPSVSFSTCLVAVNLADDVHL
jgi:hypothetical protein